MPDTLNHALLPEIHWGSSPLLISVPHAGTGLLAGMEDRMTPEARPLPDTDWFVGRLYEFARQMDASMLLARTSRFVVDLNRPADDQPLYDPGQTSLMTGVLPLQCFSGAPVYLAGAEPTAAELESRLKLYWQPYHDLLRSTLQRIRQEHGYAVLLDAHSIKTEMPLLFDGVLPDLNLGSNEGRSTDPELLNLAHASLQHKDYSLVVDGRFKGGYITRNYGQPANRVHALQLEIAQANYMQEEPPAWVNDKASRLQDVLKTLVETLQNWRPAVD